MNTGKQINAMVVVLFLTLIAVGAYTIWDPFRSESAEDRQLDKAAEFGATTYSLNCRLCHGDRGEGGAAGGRLPESLPLDRPDLQGIVDGVFNQKAFDDAFKLVTDTIVCGRAGKKMPMWGESQGGILSEEQVRQLAILITEGRWDLAQEHADEVDAEATEHATVEMPGGSLAAGETELIVSNAGPFSLGQYIRIEEERLRVLPKELVVERGVDGTQAAAHDRGASVLKDGVEAQRLAEAVKPEDTALVVSDTEGFAVGETLQLGDEKVRVADIVAGIPSTGQVLAEEIGRTPRRLLASGAEGIETGAVIRLDGELMEVTAIRDDGDPDIELEGAVAASATRIPVSDPTFFREGYVLRLDDELVEVIGPLQVGQTLGEAIGRAQTTISVSGTQGIEEGMVIRLDQELLRVTDILQPSRVEVERGVDDTAASPHAGGTAVLKVVAEPEEGQVAEDPRTGQTLMQAVSADDGSLVVSGTLRLVSGQKYRLGDEIVLVKDVQPARLRVQRAAEGSKRAEHARRAAIFNGNLLAVERGVQGTSPSAHDEGAPVYLTELEVKRAAGDSKPEEHSKNAEIYLGNRLTVARGVLGTEPAEHENGQLVRNFVLAPEGAAVVGTACGQYPPAAGAATPTGPVPTPPAGAQPVAVSLIEWGVVPDPATIAAGTIEFKVTNDGAAVHNFRVIRTDLAPDKLPQKGPTADEEQLEVVGGFTNSLDPGGTQSAVVELTAGNYVLICNVPTHYQTGMYGGFEVTP